MWKWINEFVATITGLAVSGVILDVEHMLNKPWGLASRSNYLGRVAMVVENAGNGPMRLGLALGELESKIVELERSIEDIKRPG